MNVEHRIDVLDRQVRALRREVQALQELVDTINSPFYKRLWWVLCGFRLRRVGRWRRSRKYPDLQ